MNHRLILFFISVIAAAVGFNDVNYLSRQFKRAPGLPPSLSREKYGGRRGGENP